MTKKINVLSPCNKEIEESKIITRPLHFMRSYTTEMKNIVVKSVPKKDQMARTLIN
ncbi:hypothetical protein OHD31_01130 [Escherichia coli]|nr:hypothetical protein [Escherichia coli]